MTSQGAVTKTSSGQTTRSATPKEKGGIERDPWLGRVAGWDDADADRRIREGLPIEIATHLQSLLELTDAEAAHLIGRSRSTYSRYRNEGQSLGTAEAERAVRFAQLLALAAETFDSLEEAKKWMREENYALGGDTPFELAETDPGARVVRNLLLGLQHGHPV
jgi:putative toxin-antitoxin system antitoxin component (TIGR02293 family)